jgi:hypothetical protein
VGPVAAPALELVVVDEEGDTVVALESGRAVVLLRGELTGFEAGDAAVGEDAVPEPAGSDRSGP